MLLAGVGAAALTRLCPCSGGCEHAVLPGHPAHAAVAAARAAGRHPEEAHGAVLGRAGTPHLAAVPQNGWERLLR